MSNHMSCDGPTVVTIPVTGDALDWKAPVFCDGITGVIQVSSRGLCLSSYINSLCEPVLV